MAEEFKINIQEIPLGNFSIIQLQVYGNFLFSQQVDLKDLAFKHLRENTRGVLVEVFAMTAIDSSGIGQLAALMSQMVKKSAPLVLVGLQSQLRSVFDLSGMINLFPIMETTQDAMKYFQGCIR